MHQFVKLFEIMGRRSTGKWAQTILLAYFFQLFAVAHSSSLARQRIHTFKVLFNTNLCSASGDEDQENIGISTGIISVPTKNVLGGRLQACCFQPKTGFYRVGAMI